MLKALLAEVDSRELNQLRADVDRMSSGLDETALQQRLLNQFQEALVAAPRQPGRPVSCQERKAWVSFS